MGRERSRGVAVRVMMMNLFCQRLMTWVKVLTLSTRGGENIPDQVPVFSLLVCIFSCFASLLVNCFSFFQCLPECMKMWQKFSLRAWNDICGSRTCMFLAESSRLPLVHGEACVLQASLVQR